MDLEKLIDKADTLGIVSDALANKMRVEEDLKEGSVDAEFRRDALREFARALGDYAIKDALRYLAQVRVGTALKTEKLQMESTFGRITKVVKDVRSEGFLSDEEYEVVKRWVADAVVEVLEDNQQWVDQFYESYESGTFERVLTEREKEMARLKAPYTEKRELLKKKLKDTTELKDQRQADIEAYADALTYEQIYEANRQYEQNPQLEETDRRSSMFSHLIASWRAIEDLAEIGGYVSMDEADLIRKNGLVITRNFYKDDSSFLDVFEEAYKEIFPDKD